MCAMLVRAWLVQNDFFALNKAVSALCITFVLAITIGVTCSLFSNFGPCYDRNGDPIKTLAGVAVEILDTKLPLPQQAERHCQ